MKAAQRNTKCHHEYHDEEGFYIKEFQKELSVGSIGYDACCVLAYQLSKDSSVKESEYNNAPKDIERVDIGGVKLQANA